MDIMDIIDIMDILNIIISLNTMNIMTITNIPACLAMAGAVMARVMALAVIPLFFFCQQSKPTKGIIHATKYCG